MRTFSVFVKNDFVRLAFSFTAFQIHVVKKLCWLITTNVLHQFLPHGNRIMFLASHFDIIHTY